MASKTVTVRLEALTQAYQAQMGQATASTKAFGSTLLSTSAKNHAAYQTLGLAALGFAAVVGVAMKVAADAAMSFEASFAGVRKTVDASEPELQALASGFRDMSKEIPVSVEELNRIGEAAGQLGIHTEDILGFTRVMADLGATTNLTSDEAADALARLANIMQTPQSEFDRMGSTVVDLGNKLASTESEIVNFGLRLAGAGQLAGLAESDVLAIGGAMSSVGVEAERGGTAVSKVLLSMTDAVNTGGEKLDLFAQTAGMSAEQFTEAWRADPAQAFLAFVQGLGASGQQGAQILNALELSDIRLIQAFLSLAGAGDLLAQSLDTGSTAWAENSALATEAAKRYETTGSQVQIAMNRINDAAISFGNVLLPIIAAGAARIGDLADMFNSLPGPVKSVVMVVLALAAGMALLAGSTLLVQSGLGRVAEAMTRAGIAGGVMRGGLTLAARAINPVTIGLTIATIALTNYAANQAEAKARVEAFTDALKADSGALGENTRALVAHELQQTGALDAAKELGIGLELLTDAALGDKDALAEVARELDAVPTKLTGVSDEVLAVAAGIGDMNIALEAGKNALANEEEAAGKAAEGVSSVGNAVDAAAGAAESGVVPVDAFSEGLGEATSAADALKTALEGLAGTELDVEKASLRWLGALEDINPELTHQTDEQGNLTSALQKGAKSLDDSTEAGRAARAVILEAIDAAIEHGAAVADETGSVQKGARAVREHIAALEAQAIKAGISKKAIREYIDQLNLTPEEIKTELELLGITGAISDLRTLNASISSLPSRKVIDIIVNRGFHGGGPVFHGGGGVFMHGGGDPPRLASDEVPAVLQRGEFVINRRAAQHVGFGFLSRLNRMHTGGGFLGGELTGPPVASGDAGLMENFLSKGIDRLEQTLEKAADMIREAIEQGISRANLASARDLGRLIDQRQRQFESMLQDARDHLDAIRAKIADFSDAVRSGFGQIDLVGGLMDLGETLKAQRVADLEAQLQAAQDAPAPDQAVIDALTKAIEEMKASTVVPTAEDMQTFLAEQLGQAQALAGGLTDLQKGGLSASLLAKLAAQGPEALPFIQALLQAGPDAIKAFNDAQGTLDELAKQTAANLSTEEFGKQLDAASQALVDLKERVSDVLDRLEDRLSKFLDAVRAEAIGKKVDDLEKALERLQKKLDGVTTTGAQSAAQMHSGGLVRGDEQLVRAQRGERLLSASQNRTLEQMLGSGMLVPFGGSSSGGGLQLSAQDLSDIADATYEGTGRALRENPPVTVPVEWGDRFAARTLSVIGRVGSGRRSL